MIVKSAILSYCLILLILFPVSGQEVNSEVDTVIYKKIDTVTLTMNVIYPPSMDKSRRYPAMVFFFGGGWVGGTIKHFERQARYFAQRGIVCFLADYRVKNRQGTGIEECISDAKSAIRYVRGNAERFNIDSDEIIAAGGSAGGHLAVATAVISGYDEQSDNIAIDPRPNALVLFNPVVDLGPSTGVYERYQLEDSYKDISPLHNVKKGAPPTIVFLGTEDVYMPVETAKYYELVMSEVGSRCDLHLYEGQEHGFFNFSRSEEYYNKTVYEADKFLISLGYLEGEPVIKRED